MDKIYLLQTIAETEKINRLRPLPHQTFPYGKAIIDKLNVQGDMTMRNPETGYPIGTIFASKTLELRAHKGEQIPFYIAKEIFPVSIPRNELRSTSHEPTEEMYKAYNDYISEYGNPKETQKTAEIRKGSMTLLEKLKFNPYYQIPTIENDGFWVAERTWWHLMTNIIDGINTMLVGPQGSGKTEIIRTVCNKLNIPLFIYDMGSMYDPQSQLMGSHRISEKGVSVFEFADFTKSIQKECVILLDELSRANPDVNNMLLPLLDNRREMAVEQAGAKDSRRIKMHPKCRIFATANIGVEFTGTKELDPVLKDRFELVEMTYMPANEEINMLMKLMNVAKVDASHIVNVAGNIRSLYQKNELQTRLSTRETIMAARKVRQGFSVKEAMEMIFLPLFEGTKAEGERAVVWNTILSM